MSVVENKLSREGSEIVVLKNGESAGSLIIRSKNKKATVCYIGVKNKYRGQGLSASLVKAGEEWAKKREVDEINGILEPSPGSESVLKNIIEKNGYKINARGKVKKKL